MNGTSRLVALLGTWGRPVDRVAWWTLVVAVVFGIASALPASLPAALGIHAWVPVRSDIRRRVVLVLAFVAAFLSLGYIAYFLRAGPRIIDATSYYLEGRVLSHGHFAWTVPTPTASFRGRFLLFREAAGVGNKLAVIFPPGFPLLLAAGFLVGAPLVIGPVLGGALVVATYWLARELAFDRPDVERQRVALLAAACSIVCVALRYHTADTMAHGASALGVTVALTFALAGTRRREQLTATWFIAGLAVGWVVCTRPVSSLATFGILVVLAVRQRRAASFLAGVLPGAAFLVVASHAQTGHWFTSAQSAYYAVSDGPPGCFRYGFGDGIGCQGEHKDFVAARLPHGYGFVEAFLTTVRRLRVHLLDIANFEPLALLVAVPLFARWNSMIGRGRARVAFAVVVGQILAYVPFYFDGDYPGGGARFFADVLPVEHALLAVAIAGLLPQVAFFRRGLGALALALFGFAVHGAFEHDALANRDGGHPMFDPEEVHTINRGLVFLDTDHGFDLAYDPYADPAHDVLAARFRGDDHDRVLVERLGFPPVHVYRNEPPESKKSALGAWSAARGGTKDIWHFEAEAEWPPLEQEGGWAEPVWVSNSCATSGRALTLHPSEAQGRGPLRVRFELPVPRSGKWIVLPRILRRGGGGHGTLRLIPKGRAPSPGDAKLVWEWNDNDDGTTPGHDTCLELRPLATAQGVELDVTGAEWELTAFNGEVSLDETTLKAAPH